MAKSDDRWQHLGFRMLAPSIRRPLCSALLGSVWLCAGCGATGLAWAGEAHSESAQQQSVSAARLVTSRERRSASIPATAEQNSTEARPRLQHTVTLGAT